MPGSEQRSIIRETAMRERVKQLGGRFEIQSNENGTAAG
jgi:signal transduction histidine kinase